MSKSFDDSVKISRELFYNFDEFLTDSIHKTAWHGEKLAK